MTEDTALNLAEVNEEDIDIGDTVSFDAEPAEDEDDGSDLEDENLDPDEND